MIHGQYILPIWYDLFATFAFGMTGAMVGLRKHYDIVGLASLAFAVGVGGGVIRDGLFLQQIPAAFMDWRYTAAILLSVVCAIVLQHHLEKRQVVLMIAFMDALGLAAYTIVGTQKAVFAGLTLVGAILVGVINAAGGGVLRDILSHEPPQIYRPGQLYALLSIVGSIIFLFLTGVIDMSAQPAALISIATIFILRMIVVFFDIRTVPAHDLVPPKISSRSTKN